MYNILYINNPDHKINTILLSYTCFNNYVKNCVNSVIVVFNK